MGVDKGVEGEKEEKRTGGWAANLDESCLVTSANNSLWLRDFLVFITRTMAASAMCERSASTCMGRAPPSAPAPSLPPLSLAVMVGTLMRLNLLLKASLTLKWSSGWMSRPWPSRFRSLIFCHRPGAEERGAGGRGARGARE